MRRVGVLVLLACLGNSAFSEPVDSLVDQGQVLYSHGDYLSALGLFQQRLASPEGRSDGDAYFWIAKSYFALLDTKNAATNLDTFLQNFPESPNHAEGLYLHGRLLFAEGDYDQAISAFGEYLSREPKGDQIPNALFWMGESAFSLGHDAAAADLYSKVVDDYPSSFKLEASRYRLSLIDLRHREEELVKLLQWSHAEALNSAAEYERRESSYRQSVEAYQAKILALQSTDLGARIAVLEDQVRSRDAQIAALKSLPTGTSPVATTLGIENDRKIQLLEAKVLALELQARLLERKASHAQ